MRIDGIHLHVDEPVGDGEPLVLVHGGWTDATTWAAAIGPLAHAHRVIGYDRRGHTRSERGPQAPTRRRHEDDLAELIERLGLGPVHLVGTSYGASIALAVAGRRPELVRSVVGHEPPLVGVEPVPGVEKAFRSIQAQLAAGDVEAGTRRFFEDSLGPGTWEIIPERLRRAAMANAQTFIDIGEDPDWAALDVTAVAAFPGPVVITRGDAGAAWLQRVAMAVAERVGGVSRLIEGAGHTPQVTHPEVVAEIVAEATLREPRARLTPKPVRDAAASPD
jgi:pimeloyl-ACP methyl ester carboxylesterase